MTAPRSTLDRGVWKVSGLGYLCRGKTVVAKTHAVPEHMAQSVTLEIEDAEYIAKACNAYPRLVAELKRLCVEIPAQLGGKPMTNNLLRELGEQ